MTLQIRSTDTISGVPLKEVRRFFRHIASWHEQSFDLNRLREKLSLTEESSRALALELVDQGYAESPENAVYKLTKKGHDLIRASAAGQVTRKTAEDALAGLLERAEKYNCDEDKPLAIEAIVIFGSFLGTKDRLGDLDVPSNTVIGILAKMTGGGLLTMRYSLAAIFLLSLTCSHGRKLSCIKF